MLETTVELKRRSDINNQLLTAKVEQGPGEVQKVRLIDNSSRYFHILRRFGVHAKTD